MFDYKHYDTYFDTHQYDVIIQDITSTLHNYEELDLGLAHYYLGKVYLQKRDEDKWMHHYELAGKNGIIEGYYELAKYHRLKSNNDKSFDYAMLAQMLPKVSNYYTMDKNVRYYLLDYELSIVAYYNRTTKQIGRSAADRIIRSVRVSLELKNSTINNSIYYLEPLPMITNGSILPYMNDIPGTQTPWKILNPSIIKIEVNRYIVMIRSVNYIQDEYGRYVIYHPFGKIITQSHLLAYEGDRLDKLVGRLQLSNSYERQRNTEHIGLEDGRLFKRDTDLYASCTTPDTNINGKGQISVVKIGDVEDIWNLLLNNDISVVPVNVYPIRNPVADRTEKNWIPIQINNELNFIYSYAPYRILTPKIDKSLNNEYDYVDERIIDLGVDLSRFHGSSPPIKYDNGFLLVVHEISPERKYIHRFVYLNNDMIPTKISSGFFFEKLQIEFCAGLERLNSNELILTYGVNDRQCCYSIINDKLPTNILFDI